ncbi:MAG: hypothetical protein DRJ33_08830, partial [Candidatus Methanomethylicota archaeon]
MTITGYLTPPTGGASIDLIFYPYKSSSFSVSVTTDEEGFFSYSFTPDTATAWAVKACYQKAEVEAFFTVISPSSTLSTKLELNYRSNITTTLPLERWVKNKVEVKNIYGKPLTLSFDVLVKCEEEWIGISPFPQPFNLYLDPGESQTIWYFIDLSYRSCGAQMMAEGEKPLKALVFIEDCEHSGDYVAVFIDHLLK